MLEGAIVLDATLCNLPEGPEDPQGPTGHNQISFDSIYIIQDPPGTISTALCYSGYVIGGGFNNIQDNNPSILMTCRSPTSKMIGSQL
jgi:hypothetical protein